MTNEINHHETRLISLPDSEQHQFKLDTPRIEVEIDVSSDPTRVAVVAARMRKPSKKELVKREAMQLTEIVEASATEDEIVVEETRGNAWLFNEICTHVKGFRLAGEPKEMATEWREMTDELRDAIYSSYKSAFVRSIYNINAKFTDSYDDDGGGVVLGGTETLPVELTVGSEENPVATVLIELPEPTETERTKYQNDSVRLRQPKGSRKTRNRIVGNLEASVKFFDKLMSRDGAVITSGSPDTIVTVNGREFSDTAGSAIARMQFLDAIDPIYKRAIVNSAMSKYNAKVQD